MAQKMESPLGRLLRQYRIRSGMTQAQVSRRLGLNSAQSVSDWEGGRSGSVPVRSLKALMQILKIPGQELLDALAAEQLLHAERFVQKVASDLGLKKRFGGPR